MNDLVDVTETTFYVTVDGDGQTIVEIEETTQSVEITAPGPQGPQGIQGLQGVQGPQGPAGDTNEIGGYGFEIANATADDLLAFNGSKWINRPQAQVADGGNF